MNKALRLALLLFCCCQVLAQNQTSTGALAPVSSTAPVTDADKPRVFVTDSQSWSIEGSSGGSSGAFAGHVAGGARPQTAEIIKTFGERCPLVVSNNKPDKADYIVLLDHEGGKGVLRHKNKVAVFNRASGDSIVSKSTLSLGGSVQDACEAITKDWSAHSREIRAAGVLASAPTAPPPPVPAAAASAPAVAAQAQMQITSTPDAAEIEIDGNYVGSTPSTVGVASGQHQISVKKTGFKPWERKIAVSSGQVNVNAVLEAEK